MTCPGGPRPEPQAPGDAAGRDKAIKPAFEQPRTRSETSGEASDAVLDMRANPLPPEAGIAARQDLGANLPGPERALDLRAALLSEDLPESEARPSSALALPMLAAAAEIVRNGRDKDADRKRPR